MTFDPYFSWLGIPAEEQPPHHYRLLGLAAYESNAEVIERAAQRLMAHVGEFQASSRADHAQRLLRELASARACLLNPAKKSLYDARLKKSGVKAAARTGTSLSRHLPDEEDDGEELTLAPLPEDQRRSMPASRPLNLSPAGPARPIQVARPPTSVQPAATAKKKDPLIEIAKIVVGGIAGLLIGAIILRVVFGVDVTDLSSEDTKPATPAVAPADAGDTRPRVEDQLMPAPPPPPSNGLETH